MDKNIVLRRIAFEMVEFGITSGEVMEVLDATIKSRVEESAALEKFNDAVQNAIAEIKKALPEWSDEQLKRRIREIL